MLIYYFVLAILVSTIFALLEIQIEGKNGWAKELPTWRFYKPWFKNIPGANKPLTGYHFYLWIFIFLLPHIIYLTTPFSLQTELLIISFVLLVLRLEDFLWFVLNPAFGLSKFKKGSIHWHNDWLGPVPVQYITSMILWAIVFFLSLSL
jgi:hypothetical protein